MQKKTIGVKKKTPDSCYLIAPEVNSTFGRVAYPVERLTGGKISKRARVETIVSHTISLAK